MKRLSSLDILRGLVLFLLVFLQPVLISFGQVSGCGWILYNFDHEVWEGFRLWDLVMPLFMFMAGVSLPFSLAKYTKAGSRKQVYLRIGKRFVLLFVLGMVVQGNLLGLDPGNLKLYNNTLQAIAVGYVIAALLVMHCPEKYRLLAAAALLLIYWLPMRLCGDYTMTGSFAAKVDGLVLGRFRGDPSYTWIWSSLNFGVTVILGSFAGTMVKNDRNSVKVVYKLLITGIACFVTGLLWGLEMPIIKRLWTSSMTLFSGGICLVLMAVFHWWIDIRGHSRGFEWLNIYGMNSIAAYVIGESISFMSIGNSLLYGFEQYLGGYYEVLLRLANYCVVFLILTLMYRNRIFIKV